MKYIKPIAFIFCITMLTSFKPAKTGYDYPFYAGNDLGVSYSPKSTLFKIWAPTASNVVLRLYDAGNGGQATGAFNLTAADNGVWQIAIDTDIKNKYYTFQAMINGKWLLERPDIYAKAVGVNGMRGMVVDLNATNPAGWNDDKKPAQKNFTDIVLYETHIRDISISPNSGILHKGKFLGLTETGTRSPDGLATGLDHLKELGVTHVHIMPFFDFNSVDESKPGANEYNWGYDPLNYNAPEGSYSTNPYDGNVRIKECKTMVQAMHKAGLRVIMDVVYNHTSDLNSNFNQFALGYFL